MGVVERADRVRDLPADVEHQGEDVLGYRLPVAPHDVARLLLLDEPTYGQGHRNAAEIMRLLHELRDDGTTLLMVSHDLQLVAEHADHVAVLRGGRVVDEGTVAEVLNNPPAIAAAGLRLPPMARIAHQASGTPQ